MGYNTKWGKQPSRVMRKEIVRNNPIKITFISGRLCTGPSEEWYQGLRTLGGPHFTKIVQPRHSTNKCENKNKHSLRGEIEKSFSRIDISKTSFLTKSYEKCKGTGKCDPHTRKWASSRNWEASHAILSHYKYVQIPKVIHT